MRLYLVSGSILLALSWACVDKKKTVRRTVQPIAQPTELASSPEINLPSIQESTQVSSRSKDNKADTISLAAKTIPRPPVRYENVAERILAEGNANELKDEGLSRIREKAMLRARKLDASANIKDEKRLGDAVRSEDKPSSLQAERHLAMAVPEEPVTELDAPAPVEHEAPVASKTETDSEISPSDPITLTPSIAPKNAKGLELRFHKALTLVKQGKVDQARNEFLSLCQSGHAHACHKFAWYEGQARNHLNSIRFYATACDKGIGKSCNNLAFQFERTKDYEKAADLYAKGCMNKHRSSCESLKRLQSKQKIEGLKNH